MEVLKRISHAEAENYIELSIYDDKVCTQAVAFTLTDVDYPDSHYGAPWQEITYYGNEASTSKSPLSPLEYMYKEWNMSKDVNNEKDWGDEREFNA
jgi:hypothetical protein